MDALMLLTADHNRVRGLFTRFETAKESKDVAQMTELAALIATELQVHAAIEEEILYPWAQELGDEIKEIITEAYEEHKVANDLVAEITSMTPDAESWAAKVTVLMENVEHHAEEEEKELFPKLRRATDATGLRVLAEQLEERKEELGAPTLADKVDLTKAELMELAREQEIPGRSSMDQEELAATVSPPMA